MSRSGLARSTGILALTTGASRILGFIRDILLAGLFGTSAQAQAFVVAFRLPNLLRDLVAEGAVTSAFVPVLSWYRAKGKTEEFWHLSQALLARLLLILVGLGLLGVVGAAPIVRLMAPGFLAEPEKFALTVRLTQILFPFIVLVGLWAYFMGLLNSLRHFAMPALGPAILNVAMIVACVWFVPRTQPPVLAVTIGVMIGGLIQLLVQLPVAVRLGFRWRWRWAHPGSAEVLKLLLPRMLGAAVYQLSILIHTALASLGAIVGEGAVAALYYATRLVQLPLALFGTASAQASLPSLSEQVARNDLAGFRSTLLAVARMVGFVIIPASVGLIVFAGPIVRGLFERGAFDHRSTLMTSQALICYSLGLMAYSMSKLLTGAFYALRDTWTPVRLAVESVTANVVLSLALMGPLQVSGLALAAAAANTWNAVRLARSLEHRLQEPFVAPVLGALGRIAAASVVMGAGCALLWRLGCSQLPAWMGLLAVIGAGLLLYAGSCALFRVQELSTVLRWVGTLALLQPSVSE